MYWLSNAALRGRAKKVKRTIRKLRALLRAKSVKYYDIKTIVEEDLHQVTPDHPDDYPLQAHNIEEVLIAAGYKEYLLQVLAEGERQSECVRRAVRIIADYLHHTHVQHYGVPISTDEEVMPWLRKVIKKHYRLLQGYAKHLAEERKCRPSTIKNYLIFIEKCCRWYVLFCPQARNMQLSALTRMKDVSAVLLRALARKEKVARAEVSLAAKVRDRRMPAGGLPELQSRVDSQLEWAKGISKQRMSKDEYEAFMEIMYAALYVYSVQGRQSGVMDMKYKQAAELLAQGYSNSTKFKTSAKWKYQPVTLSSTTYLLLQIYVTRVRPQVFLGTPAGADPLWLAYDGSAERKLGLRVTRFFRKTAGLHITTTAIRSLVETAMHAGFRQGRITQQEMQSVQAINGHSSQVTEDYYIQEDRAQDVTHARTAFQRCVGQQQPVPYLEQQQRPRSPGPSNSPPPVPAPPAVQHVVPITWAAQEPLAATDWGREHPSYGNGTVKAPWTDAEVRYIGNWCDQHPAPPGVHTNLVAMCLRHMKTDAYAQAIFHEHHVLDNSRLRHGYRTYLQMKEKGTWVSGL